MKKALSIVMAMILAVSCMTFVASAANTPSAEVTGSITGISTAKDQTGKPINANLKKPTNGKRNPATDEKLGSYNTSNSTSLKIVDTKVIDAPADSYPLTVDLNVLGVKATSKGVILFVKSTGEVVELPVTFADNKVTVTFPEAGEFSLAVDADTAASIVEGSKDGTSQQTSDSATPIAMVLICLGAVAATYSFKKIRA